MMRKIYRGLVALGIFGLCVGLIGCEKSKDAAAESTVPLEKGEHVIYGNYQGEAIEWRVLDKKGDEVLLISEYGLDAQPFDTSGKERVEWEDSTIRKWLNDDFYNSAFSEDEKANIVLSASEGFEKNNESIHAMGGKPYAHLERGTEDKLFLLSYTELVQYFPGSHGMGAYESGRGYDEIVCYPTEYAKQRLDPFYKTEACGWWLCNPQYDTGDGSQRTRDIEMVSAYGEWKITQKQYDKENAVRPAMWVTWQSNMQAIDSE